MGLVKRLIRYLARVVLKQKRIRSVVITALKESDRVSSHKSFGRFVDSYGNSFDLLENLRNQIWPGWQDLVTRYASLDIPSEEKITGIIHQARLSVQKCLELLKKLSIKVQEKHILEVGCYNGARAFALMEMGASSVTASDMLSYYLDSEPSQSTVRCVQLRETFRKRMLEVEDRTRHVEFVNDDICASTLPSSRYDIVVSWDVLEHVENPKEAISHMYRLLKRGGVACHVYHPFFCLTGGHGFCTLDFLWGHVRVSEKDFVRYVREWRPQEIELAERYYNKSLNRLSLRDLQAYCSLVGFEIIALIPFWKREHLEMVQPEILMQSTRLYPNLTINDLITQSCTLVLRKAQQA